MKKFADTPTKRFFKLSKMGVKLAGHYSKHRIKTAVARDASTTETQRAALYDHMGREVLTTLGEMKGAAMKVGQIASQLKHLFPQEFAEQISKLQKDSPPVDYDIIARQIQQCLGFPPEKLFRSFEEKPFAAASIGQVHRAITHQGESVVIKVQYPGVYRSCLSDLKQLKRVFRVSGLIQADRQALDAIFNKVETSLLIELDYEQEAANLKAFAAFHSKQPNVRIPKVHEAFSGDTVLTLSDEQGIPLKDAAATLDTETLNHCASLLIETLLHEILFFHKAHADPHPGNFAFSPEGQLIIYDYGCVAEIAPFVVDRYCNIITHAMNDNFAAIDDELLALGVRVEGTPAIDEKIYAHWYHRFLAPAIEQTQTTAAIEAIHRGIREEFWQFTQYRHQFQPSAHTLFFNRIISGHFLNLVEMGIETDLKPLVTELIQQRNRS